jgi:hypothetical protein
MKDRLDDHTPRAYSWDKILGRMSFEDQLQGHTANLPEFGPNTNSWEKISAKLEDKKPIPLYSYFGLAAGVIGILLVSNLVWNEKSSDFPQMTAPHSLTEISTLDLPFEYKFQIPQKPEKTSLIVQPSIRKQILEIKDSTLPKVEIEAPKIEFIALSLELIIPVQKDSLGKISMQAEQKTLHEVTISWSIKPSKFQVKTGFGKSDPVKLEEKQVGRSGRTGRIRFGKNN